MNRITSFVLLLLVSLLASLGTASGQSITVSPTMPSVAIGNTVQFSAQVSGLSGNDVMWYAGGAKGGNATAGTISPAGQYKAPAALPGQNPVQVMAVSTANPKIAGTTYVNILSLGPTITSVTPNPLAVGTITVTIKGSGIRSGAMAFISYGTNQSVQLTTTAVTATSITATGYQGPATTSSFCVRNPGSICSNTLSVPVGSTGSTTHALTVVNGTGSGSYAAGTVVTITANPPPAGQSFVNWTGATVVSPTSAATVLTMPAANTTVTANYSSVAVSIPYPVTTHPRLWVTQADLPRLQGWATAGNLIYQHGMVPLLAQAVSYYANYYFPGGVANANYPDNGDTQGYGSYTPSGVWVPISEELAVVFAFNSLIDPSAAKRIQYAQYARNLIMYAMNRAALGHTSGVPFRDPLFAVYNRANASGQLWPLIVDWIYNAPDGGGNPILTAADKATIRNVFMMWANDCLNASTTGGDHPSPIGVTNSLHLLPNNQPYRMAANNYYLGHARVLTMMALSIDPADDPVVNSAAPASQLGNTLRSYLLNANGAWLYQQFAMFGDPATVASAYGIAGNGAGFGLASGGLPPEGMLYGHSYAYVLAQLLALQTAGFNNVGYSGPQIQLIGAPVWDRFVTGFIASLTPVAHTFASQPWLGPVYQFGSYGDLLRLWVTPDFLQPFALLALLDQKNGKAGNLNAARWMAVNGTEGGAAALLARVSNSWTYGTTQSILYFMLLDPAAAAAADPRSTFPSTLFYDPAAGRIVAHSDWSANGTMFDYRASWESINHQDGDGGQFEFYRKGEWLTKEMSNYDSNSVGLTTTYHNTLALQNWSQNGTPSLNWFETGEWANGSQWILGANAGDPTTAMSSGTGYVYVASNLTNLYNRPNFWTPAAGATDILQAMRSIVWLNSDYIVVYDRATSIHASLFKRFNLSLVTNPAIAGNTATETLASGQRLYVQTLLPQNPAISASNGAANLNTIAQLEPTQYILTVQDPTLPTDTRFLHVLQGADLGTAMVSASYLKSTAGTSFDGAAFGGTAVYFPVNGNAAFTGTTLPAPSGVHTVLVTGLAHNTTYAVSVQPNGSGNAITIAPGAAGATSDAAGLLRLTF